MKSKLLALLRDRSGNFAMITALSMLPALAAVGLAVDYVRASHVRSALMDAADAAAAGAVSMASPTYRNGGSFSAQWSETQAEHDAVNLFRANLVDNVGFTLDDVQAHFVRDGRRITARIEYTATVPLTFMRIFGNESVVLDGNTSAAVQTAEYLDFYLLLDNSPSMGLAAGSDAIAKLVELTAPFEKIRAANSAAPGCAFACHDTGAATNAAGKKYGATIPNRVSGVPGNDYVGLARDNGVKLRIDTLHSATKHLYAKGQDTSLFPHQDQIRMALYSFGATADSMNLTQIMPLSSDLRAGEKFMNDNDPTVVRDRSKLAFDLMSIPYQNYMGDQMTRLDDVFAQADAIIRTSEIGSGDKVDDRRKVLFLVSDGVANQPKSACTEPVTSAYPRMPIRCQEPIDYRKICQSIKNRTNGKNKISIAVLYTTYQPVVDTWYTTWISPFQPRISTSMRECASPGLFYEVPLDGNIVHAMEVLFLKAVGNPRITG